MSIYNYKKSFVLLILSILTCITCFVNVSALGTNTKAYFDMSGTPLTQITQGGTYKVTFSYQNTGNQIEETSITNFIGLNQHYVPNSLVLPKYWEIGPDTDLATTSTNAHFEIDGEAGPMNGIGKLTPNTAVAPTKIPAALKKTATGGAGGGDGYVPVFWENTSGSIKRVCEIYHHDYGVGAAPTGARINCQDDSNGSLIPGYPKRLSEDAPTNAMTWNYMDGRDGDVAQVGSKIYVGAMKSNFVLGILCFDLLTDSPCSPSFIPLSAPGMDIGVIYSSGLTGIYRYQDYLYVAGFSVPDSTSANNKPRIFCWNIVTGAYCSGFTMDGIVNDYATPEFITMSQYSDKLIVADSAGTPGSLNCYNIGAGGAITQCSGFPLSTNKNVSPQYYLDHSGNVIGFCVLDFKAENPPLCYDFVGNALTPLPLMTPANIGYSGTSLKVGTKVYYPTALGYTYCWDFALNDTPQGGYCPSFKDNGDATHPPIVGLRRWNYPTYGSTTEGIIPNAFDYGFTLFKGCVYGLGDSGTLWTFDSDTGESPCIIHIGTTNVSSIQSSACSANGIVNNVEKFGWVYPKGNVYPPGLTTLTMTIYSDEAMTKPIPGYTDVDVPASGINLTGLDIVTYPSIWMRYVAVGSYDEDFKIFATFQMENPVTYAACFEVKVDDICDIGNLINQDAILKEVTSGITTHIPTNSIPVLNNASCVGAIGDLVWNDVNHNGIQDAGEPPLPGIKIDLVDSSNAVLNSANTDPTGKYLFSSIPSNKKYKIHVNSTLASTQISPKNVGTDRKVDSDINASTMSTDDILVHSGITDTDSGDAGLENNSTIMGTISLDSNFDNIRQVDEAGIAGITVNILDETGKKILTTTTDLSGKYYFFDISSLDISKKYHVQIQNISKYIIATKSIGSDKSIDSDFDKFLNADEFSPPVTPTALTFDASLQVKNTDVQVTIAHAGESEFLAGDQVNFIYTVHNNGPFTVDQLTLEDTIPAELLKFSDYTPSKGKYDPISKVWSGLSLAVGESITMTYSAFDIQDIDSVVNVAANIKNLKESTGDDIVDTNLPNNSATDSVKIAKFRTDLKVEKSHFGTGLFKRGDRVDFKITVTNLGNTQVDSLSLLDTFPAELHSLDNWSADQGVYTLTEHTWTGLTLKPNASASLYVSATVLIDETRDFLNKVEISNFSKMVFFANAVESTPTQSSSSSTSSTSLTVNTGGVLGANAALNPVEDTVASNNIATDKVSAHKVLANTGSGISNNLLIALSLVVLSFTLLRIDFVKRNIS